MAVRRHAARLATVCALLGGLVTLGATPAFADDDSVRVRAAGSFTAGGSAEGVSMEVRKRSDGCVLLRTALGLRLSGLRADQVRAEVNAGGRWFPVPVSGGPGSVSTGVTSPANPRLCKGKSITVRYRVAFAPDAPAGRLTVVGDASTALGRQVARGGAASRVVGGRVSASPTPTPTPSKKPSPTPSAVVTEAAGDAATVAAVAGPVTAATTNAAEESSGGSPIMFFGIAMVAVGILLIVLLFRRNREEKEPREDLSGVPLPRNPGGTTYRSAQGPAAAPAWPGQMYGQQPPATPTVYGGTSAPRPSGAVYGAGPAATSEGSQPVTGAPVPPPARPAVPPVPGQYGGAPVSGPPAAGQYGGAPVSGPPAASEPGPSSAAPGPVPPAAGQPGTPPPGTSDGGDHTVMMPRLPG